MKQVKILSKLPPKPVSPQGVKYALSVPQSVLFADLSLQGNQRKFFQEAMGLDYEPAYIAIDGGGAMSWNYGEDTFFNKNLLKDGNTKEAINHFIAVMGSTSRKLLRRSELGSQAIRRPANAEDIIEDLSEYWYAYKLHMTSLFTFWNAERLLSNALAGELKKTGMYKDETDVERFIRSSETNQFVRERRSFKRLAKRFADDPDNPSVELIAALEHHAREFAFLLTPFNLGEPSAGEALLGRLAETRQTFSGTENVKNDELAEDLPANVKELALIAQDLTFWKNERLDVLSLADALVAPLYQAAAQVLQLPASELFAMTSQEISESLLQGKPAVSAKIRAGRMSAYCLVLHGGTIAFYRPSAVINQILPAGDSLSLQGRSASGGIAKGRVKVIRTLADLNKVKLGDILVTAMTRPEYGVALDRAAAFITDEGGLLCHAAIIAREMKKPCVIATGNATFILRDDMFVEVDGNSGQIKIL